MKRASFVMLGLFLLGCGESTVPAPKVAKASPAASIAAPKQTSAATVVSTKAAASPAGAATSAFRFQDPVYPEDASKKLMLDAPRESKAEKYGDGQEVVAGFHFHLWIGPGWESDLGKDDRTTGYGLTNIKWVKREKKEIVYQATSRDKATWFAETMVDVPSEQEGEGAETYRCAIQQSIVAPESFTKEDAYAMLAACRSLRRAK